VIIIIFAQKKLATKNFAISVLLSTKIISFLMLLGHLPHPHIELKHV